MTGSGRYACHAPGVSDAVIRIAQTRCEMFLSETVAQAVHADRVRDLERAARDRRLLAADDEVVSRPEPQNRIRVAPATSRPACSDSAGQPA